MELLGVDRRHAIIYERGLFLGGHWTLIVGILFICLDHPPARSCTDLSESFQLLVCTVKGSFSGFGIGQPFEPYSV